MLCSRLTQHLIDRQKFRLMSAKSDIPLVEQKTTALVENFSLRRAHQFINNYLLTAHCFSMILPRQSLINPYEHLGIHECRNTYGIDVPTRVSALVANERTRLTLISRKKATMMEQGKNYFSPLNWLIKTCMSKFGDFKISMTNFEEYQRK